METKTIKRIITLVILLSVFIPQMEAQKHDKSKFYQIRSMEDGKWQFTPGLYYWTLHRKYSGAYWSGLNIKTKESKSNVKRVATPRAAQIPLEIKAINHLNSQIDSIQPVVNEETIRSAQRMVDIVYPQYKDSFMELGKTISESLAYCMSKSGGKMSDACEHIQMEYDVICSEIEYMRKTGIGNEVEPTKRQLTYEDARNRLTDLSKSCGKLVRYVDSLF